MPELTTPDGSPVDADAINARFDRAMNDDGPDPQAPPPRPPQAEASASPPRAPRRGRQPKEEKARVTDTPAAEAKDDYTADAQQTVGGVWVLAAQLSFTQPYAVVIDANSDGLVAALAEGAKHNTTVRKFVGAGGNSWMLQLAAIGVTMSFQALEIARDAELRAEAAEATRTQFKALLREKGIKLPEDKAGDTDGPART